MSDEPTFWVVFAGPILADTCPVFALGPATHVEAVRLRSKDGHYLPMDTIFGQIPVKVQWIACIDHEPTKGEMESLARRHVGDNG